jgi:hypothetical protein
MSRLGELLTEMLAAATESAADLGLGGSHRRPRGAATAALLAGMLAVLGLGVAAVLPPGALARVCAGLGYSLLAVALACGLAWAGLFNRPPR